MEAERFAKAMMKLSFDEVLDDQDVNRVMALCSAAAGRSEDNALVGFQLPGPGVRIIWVHIALIPLGHLTDEKDLAPDLPPGDYEGWDLRPDGLTLSEGPAELAHFNEAKPPELADAAAILFPYPGQASWEELLSACSLVAGEGET